MQRDLEDRDRCASQCDHMRDRSALRMGAPAGDIARWIPTSHNDIWRRRHSVLHRPSPSHARAGPSALSRRLVCAYSVGLLRRVACSSLVCWPSDAVSSALMLCRCVSAVLATFAAAMRSWREPFHWSAWHLHGPLSSCSAALGTVRFLCGMDRVSSAIDLRVRSCVDL